MPAQKERTMCQLKHLAELAAVAGAGGPAAMIVLGVATAPTPKFRRTDQTNQSNRSRTTHVPPNRPTNVDATPHIGRPLRAKPRKAQVTARHGLFEELAPQHLVLSSIGGVERATTRPRAG